MRVFIAGVDGYLGWSLAKYLAARGYEVAGADALLRRRWVEEMGSHSAIPVPDMRERLSVFEQRFRKRLHFFEADLTDARHLEQMFVDFKPDAIVLFGTRFDKDEEDALLTRLDFDQAFGTSINRFCCQAVIDHPLTLYGAGHQKRGFIPLRESMECLMLALEHPPERGEYRVFNQFAHVFDLSALAERVGRVAGTLGVKTTIRHLRNPRREAESHEYRPDHQKLRDLGYKPSENIDEDLRVMLEDLLRHRERIVEKKDVLIPDIRWDGRREKVDFTDKGGT